MKNGAVFTAIALAGGFLGGFFGANVANVHGANVQPLLTGSGKVQFPENATPASISASGGKLTIAAGGSNQNVAIVPTGTGYLFLTQNAGTPTAPPSGTIMHIAGVDGTAPRAILDAFGSAPSWEGRQASNTAASPSATILSATLGQLVFRGYGTTGYSASPRAKTYVVASELWTDTKQGTYWRWEVTPTGGTSTAPYMVLDSTGLRVGDSANASYSVDAVGDVNAGNGYRIAGTATLNHVLVGNGSRYVDGAVPAYTYNGHTLFSGTPTINSCGTGSPAVSGVDSAFKVSVGGGVVTSCSINFGTAFSAAPSCVMTDNSTAITGDISSVTTSSVTFAFSASLGGGTIWAHCF